MIAFATPASADTYTENFDDDSYDLSVQLGGGAFWCNTYANQYGTEGASLCMFNTQSPTVFEFPVPVQGFQFVAGAKNGTVPITVVYDDETTAQFPVDGSCCEATIQVVAPEDLEIISFSLPADWDLWLFDSLEWVGSLPDPTTTSTETVLPTSTVEQTSSTSTTSTSSTVPTTTMPPPPDTQPTVETTSPSTVPETTVVPSTTASPTTVPPTTTTSSSSTTLAPTTTVATPDTTLPPDASGSPESDATPDPVVDTGVVEQPPSDAPIEERLEFESKVDVFSGEYDNYVPVGSTISVAQRRTVVAATAVLIMFAPPPSRMRRR